MTEPDDDALLRHDPQRREKYAREFLDLFYPVHYRIGIGIEDAMRRGKLSRHQVAVMWLLRTEAPDTGELRRKAIERRLTSWFELQNSAVSKTLRSLAQPPHELIEIFEDPDSGREKRVRLTRAGHTEIDAIIEAGTAFIETMVDHLTEQSSIEGVRFLSEVSEIIEIVNAEPEE
ncbi:MAG: winged helix DNA-binding protein [Actinomycetota bacterium]